MRTERPRTVLAGRYVLEEMLGRSDVGVAWRARDTVLDRHVCVKLIRPELSDAPGFAERFAREARAAALLSHPGLVRLLDIGTEDSVAFLVRELIDGESAREWIDREGPRPAPEAARVAASVLDALGQAHRAGVLHLALTPENVFLGTDGSVRVTDVGVSHAVIGDRSAADGTHTVEGGLLAPEQLAGNTVDARTDVWAAGALLYELLTGHTPSGSGSARSVRHDVPRDLDAAVARALSPDPADRFASAQSFGDALRGIAGLEAASGTRLWPSPDEGRAAMGEPLPAPARQSLFRTWLAVPLLVVVLAVVALAVGLSLGELTLGGPVGIRLKHEETRPTPTARALRFVTARAYDPPPGDGTENDANIPLATDGDPATAWKSENYYDGELHKPGVGILFDLGSQRTVTAFHLETPWPGFAFRIAIGDDPAVLAQEPGPTFIASPDMHETIRPVVGRYVLLWFTSVVPTDDGNRIEVAEFRMLGF